MRYLHTMIRASDLDKTLEFFISHLGLIQVRRYDNEQGRFTLVFLAASGDVDHAEAAQSPLVEITYNWDSEDWARDYFVSTMGNPPMSLEEAPKDFKEWANMIAKDYEPARYWFESEFKTNCLEPRMAPVKDKKPGLYQECKSSSDCDHPMF